MTTRAKYIYAILGPLLFIIYINDIVSATNKFYLIIYADDTTLSATLNTFRNENEIIKLYIKLVKIK